MNALSFNYWGQTKAWWAVLLIGLAMIICGFVYWFMPIVGYVIASQLFGWMLIVAGVVQLIVSTNSTNSQGRGWWLVGGVIDIFIGFMLVRSIILSEMVFPFFIAFIFIYWGISALISAVNSRQGKYWWLQLINGVLMLVIAFFFLESGYMQNILTVSLLTSLAFIYWGMSIAMASFDMKPTHNLTE